MPQPKKYETSAERVRAFRERKRLAKAEAEQAERDARAEAWTRGRAIRAAVRQKAAKALEEQRTRIFYQTASQFQATSEEEDVIAWTFDKILDLLG